MNIPKAIELTEYLFVRRPNLIDKDYDAAIKLLIEAGKLLKGERELHTYPAYKLLPGETID